MAEKHYYEQLKFTDTYLIPYFEKHIENFSECKVLEVGCAEGGFVKFLHDKGMTVKGVELEEARVKIANEKAPELDIVQGDITDKQIVSKLGGNYDLIVMRDVIEHVPDREAAFENLRNLLKDSGWLYITFPPRFSGFAGHQQNGKSFFRYIPYLHLAPDFIIRKLGKYLNESDKLIKHVITNYKIGLTISKFEKLSGKYNFEPVIKDFFLFRPIYKIRFGVNTIKIPDIPVVREFLAFGCESLLKKKV